MLRDGLEQIDFCDNSKLLTYGGNMHCGGICEGAPYYQQIIGFESIVLWIFLELGMLCCNLMVILYGSSYAHHYLSFLLIQCIFISLGVC